MIVENHAWGLNFVSEEEAQKFLDFCCVCNTLSTAYVSFLKFEHSNDTYFGLWQQTLKSVR